MPPAKAKAKAKPAKAKAKGKAKGRRHRSSAAAVPVSSSSGAASKRKEAGSKRKAKEAASTRTAKGIRALLDKFLEPSVPITPVCKYPHAGIRVGSACSGWCSELFALEAMKVKFTSCFCCGIGPHAATLLPHFHDHHVFISDVTSNDFFNRAPSVDFFMAASPWQSFSPAGLGGGIKDPRGSVVFFIIHWLELRQPQCFLLENVEGLYTRHASALLLVLETLGDLKNNAGEKLYNVTWKILNARTRGGLPQNRSRLFIAGVRTDKAVGKMTWPGEARRGGRGCCEACELAVLILVALAHFAADPR